MKSILFVILLGVVMDLSCAASYYPSPYIVGGSFYNPRYIRNSGYRYVTPGQMTATVMGDTVATNSYSGQPFLPAVFGLPKRRQVQEQITETPIVEPESVNETEPESVSNEVVKDTEQETLFSIEEGTTEPTTVKTPITTRVNKKIKVGKSNKRIPVVAPPPANQEDEEDEEDDTKSASWPFGPRGGSPGYNAFFPIFISGTSSGRAKSRNSDEIPGSATAIANAFSTGKGGVATSHATAFGDPYAAALLRNSGMFSVKRKTSRTEDEE